MVTTPSADISVVIPTKDRPELLRQAVSSALAQEGVEVRVVVVDDGGAVPAEQALPDDTRIQVHRNEASCGVSAARNAGLDHVESSWVAFLDDDDLWAAHKLRRQLAAARDTGHLWACSGAVNFTADEILDLVDPPASDDLAHTMLRGNYVPGGGSNVLVRTDLVRDVAGFDTSLSSLADWDCWIRLAQRSPVARVPHPDVGYRVHADGMGVDVRRQELELAYLQDKYAALPDPLLIQPDDHFLSYWARTEYRAGNWRGGLGRTRDLVLRHHRLDALLTPLHRALPAGLQRRARAFRLDRRGHQRQGQDWAWLLPHLAPSAPSAP